MEGVNYLFYLSMFGVFAIAFLAGGALGIAMGVTYAVNWMKK